MNSLLFITYSLRNHPFRSALVILVVVFTFTLFGVLVGVQQSFDNTISSIDSSSSRVSISSRISRVDPLPYAYIERIREIESILAVVPSTFFLGYYQMPTQWVGGFAVDASAEFEVYSEFVISQDQLEEMRNVRNGAIVGKELLEQFAWEIGDIVPITSQIWQRRDGTNSWLFEIVGTYEDPEAGNARSMFINYDYFDAERTFGNGTVSGFQARVQPGMDLRMVSNSVDMLFSNSSYETLTQSSLERRRNNLRQLGDIQFIVLSLTGASLLMLLLLISNEIRQSTDDRMSEYAVLKAIGFSGARLSMFIFYETLLIISIGAFLGLLSSTYLITLLPESLGDFHLPTKTLFSGAFIALLLTFVSALFPAIKVNNVSVTSILHTP